MFIYTFIIIGLAYYNGEGTPIDMDKALACFVLAADQKYMNAIHNAIVIYEDRIKKDEEKIAFYNAFKNEDEMIQWIVDNSNPNSQARTGFMHSYSSPEEFKKMWGDEWQDGFQRRFVKWPTEDIKTMKAAIAKLQAKIDKELK